MNRMPQCLVIVDPNKEKNAIREARRLGITTVALIDTDCDPESVDLPIPGNDDGIRSIELIMSQLADAVLAGKAENQKFKRLLLRRLRKPSGFVHRRNVSQGLIVGRSIWTNI